MIVADSSAILAMILEEPEAEEYYAIPRRETITVISAVSCYEVAVVLMARHGSRLADRDKTFFASGDFEIAPFTNESYAASAEAYRRYRKGKGSRPHLNFGDCVSYALAKTLNLPLLFKGNDFAATDIPSCR
jgi:ribonuclease VapC